MRIIMTISDLQFLSQANVLPKSYSNYLEEEWNNPCEAFNFEDPIEEFTLKDYGYIVCIEPGDNNLSLFGLKSGLLNNQLGYIDIIQLDDITIYRIGVLYDNEYMVLFYSIAGTLDPETEAWLVEQSTF